MNRFARFFHIPPSRCGLAAAVVLALLAQVNCGSSPKQPAAAAGTYDVLIENGHIMDGTGNPWYQANIAIRGDRIVAIGKLAGAHAKRVIDASGLVVAPGFIDMLGQSELAILADPHVESKLFQGITTEITGEGDTVAPQNERTLEDSKREFAHYGIAPDWRTFAGYFARLQKQGMGINLGTYVGATQVRRYVIGDDARAATPAELDQMKALVAEAMREHGGKPFSAFKEALTEVAVAKLGPIGAEMRRLRADPRTRLVPVVILSSSVEERELVRGYRLGANSWVRKPVDFAEFADAARQLGLYWLGLNERAPPGGYGP